MLNLGHPDFNKIKRTLLRQKKEVEEEIKKIQSDDPILADSLAESVESGSASWMADVHSKATALKENLQDLLSRTQKSLMRINKGNYGKCEKCGKMIELERLEAMPTATLCITDSKKTSKK